MTDYKERAAALYAELNDVVYRNDIERIERALQALAAEVRRETIQECAKACDEYAFALERNGEHLTKLVAWQAGSRVRALLDALSPDAAGKDGGG